MRDVERVVVIDVSIDVVLKFAEDVVLKRHGGFHYERVEV